MKKLKRYLSLLLSCTIAFSNSVFSCAETVSNTEYVHSDDIDYDNNAELEVMGSHTDNDIAYKVDGGYIYFNEASGAIVDADNTVTNVVIPDKINGIEVKIIKGSSFGGGAFAHCTELTNITLCNNITEIGQNSFYNTRINNIEIPATVNKIDRSAFQNIPTLERFVVDDANITYTDVDGVLYTKNLETLVSYPNKKGTSFSIPNTTKFIGDYAFTYCELNDIYIPNSVQTIGYDCFYHCVNLTNLTIPDSVYEIGYYAFYGCKNIEKIIIPCSTGSNAFNQCTNLKEVIFNGYKIGDNSFSDCENLASVILTEKVYSIGSRAFSGCKELEEIDIPDAVTEIGDGAFANSGLKKITIPSSITEINYDTFAECTDLLDVEFNNTLTTIGNYAFSHCEKLKTIILPETVESISDYAFANCYDLNTISMSKSIKSVAPMAFYLCTNLQKAFIYRGTAADDLKLYPSYTNLLYINEPINEPSTETTTEYLTEETTEYIGDGVHATNIKLGDYVKAGNYLGEDIIWRCVSFDKIVGYDANSNPIIDSTDTVKEYKQGYLPLLISDKIISLKQYDTPGSNTTRSHGRSVTSTLWHTDGTYEENYDRCFEGSDYWRDSNIRCWLNADTETVEWICGNPPYAQEDSVYIDYSNERGFLNSFKDTEVDALLTVNQKQLLCEYEYSKYDEKGNIYPALNPHIYNGNIADVVQNYNNALSEVTTDKVFLPDVMQINNLWKNFDIYYKTNLTDAAIEQYKQSSAYADYVYDAIESSISWYYYLRTPGINPYSGDQKGIHVRSVSAEKDGYSFNHSGWEDNEIDTSHVYDGRIGIRPCFYLNTNKVFYNGNGEENTPYDFLVPEIVEYPVVGGNIYFDKTSGTITGGDTSITEAIIPEYIDGVKVVAIADEAFYRKCGNLTNIELPNTIKYIGKNAFAVHENLTSINIPNSVNYIGESAFFGCGLSEAELPDSITYLGSEAFRHCENLKRIKLPQNIKSIDYLFIDCKNLTEVAIPTSITSMNHTFSGCKSLKNIEIPASVVSMDGAFASCSSLESIILPNGISKIGTNTFYFCSNLTNVELPDNVTVIEKNAFYGCTNLSEINISNNVVEIGDFAFARCKSLTSVIIPDTIKSVGDGVFSECNNLSEIYLSKNIEKYNGIFSGCPLIESIIIPENVKSIGMGAFQDNKLKNLYILTKDATIDEVAFNPMMKGLNYEGLNKECTVYCYKASTADNVELYPEGIQIKYFEDENLVVYPVENGYLYFDALSGTITDCTVFNEYVTVPNEINNIEVAAIDENAFSSCSQLRKIYCAKGSVADNKVLYPSDVEIAYNDNNYVFGDADGDNVITASDAAFVLQKTLISTFELPIQKKTDDWLKYTDVDADNNITASDAAFILQKTLISTFELPAEKKYK